MRKLSFVLLVLLLMTVPVMAQNWGSTAYYNELSAVSWLEDKTVEVALVNESNVHFQVTISTNTMDDWYRPVIDQRTVQVPARSIITESFNLSNRWKDQPINLKISRGYQQDLRIPVQMPDIFSPSSYIIRAGDQVDIDVDIGKLLGQSEDVTLSIDDHYSVSNSNTWGRLDVKTVEGGFNYNQHRNTIEYKRPQLVLGFRAPQINNVATVKFFVSKEYGGRRNRRESVEGPSILVYGRNVRFAEGRYEPPRRPRLIVR